MSGFTTCLWFDTEAQDAAKYYTEIFPNSSIGAVTPYQAGERTGQTLTVDFVLDGQKFIALNGGPEFTFNEAISFQIPCADQAEVDRYWETFTQEGEEGQCGWLKDRYGLSWQVVPDRLTELMTQSDAAAAARVTEALFGMKKIVIADLEAAAAA
jgi:predicted 3-demethylubiquinone-9 3-methyltransferase (glyoxalase superfamily)